MTQGEAQYLVPAGGKGGGSTMSTLVTEQRLRDAIRDGTFLTGGDVSSVEGVKYDFHTGQRILKASYGRAINLGDLPVAERNQIFIAPGEVVFVLTQERLNLPGNVMAMLSQKRKLSHGGIMVLGGQAIDPRYTGVLWFGMYNFSSNPYPLEPGRKLIAATFYELDDIEAADLPEPESANADDFPPELVALVNQYKPIELKGLQESLNETRRELTALKADLASDKTWRDEFKRGLDELKSDLSETTRQLATVISGLDKESSMRVADDKALGERLTNMSNLFFGLRLGWAALIAVLLIVIGVLAGIYIPKLLAPAPAAIPPPQVTTPTTPQSTAP